MYGPKLNCFTEPDYGVPGNADTIGVITNDKTISSNPGPCQEVRTGHQEGLRIRLLATLMTPLRFSSRKPRTRI